MSLFVRYWWHASIENMSESAGSILWFVLLFAWVFAGLWCSVLILVVIMRFHLKLLS